MLIVIDAGNTSIKLGFAHNSTLIETITLPSAVDMHTADSLGLYLLNILNYIKKPIESIEAILVSSVVPALDGLIQTMSKKYFNKDAYIIGKNIAVPLDNLYDNPKEVGADRLMAAYAARLLYPEAQSIISVDFGTATTFDCIEKNSYLGGLICPGILSSHTALSQKAAKLPRIALEVEDTIPQIGRNTAISIAHGFVFGFSAMTEGLLDKLSRQLQSQPFIVATGGFAPDIAKHVIGINVVEPHLILLGLVLLYQEQLNNNGVNYE